MTIVIVDKAWCLQSALGLICVAPFGDRLQQYHWMVFCKSFTRKSIEVSIILLSSSNIDKCNISLRIDDIILKLEPHLKILGVFLDDKLSFNQHVSFRYTKAARQLNALARISRYLNISSRSLLYNSFVRSNFNYCAMVWHFCGKTNNNKIENTHTKKPKQERALRII